MSDILVNFGCLDELTQVIYKGICKFVVLSVVSDDHWNVHVGLAGPQGRWWRGAFTKGDIAEFFGSNLPEHVLEACAEKLADYFIQGDMCITDWSPEEGASIKFTLGSKSKKPLHVQLREMSSKEAAAHATQVFTSIAVQAQSRKCRLYPSSVDMDDAVLAANVPAPRARIPSKRKESSPEIEMTHTGHRSSNDAGSSSTDRRHIARTTSNKPLGFADTQKPGASEGSVKAKPPSKLSGTPAAPENKPVPTLARRAKGASLANPNKKARKYQAIEFASDDE